MCSPLDRGMHFSQYLHAALHAATMTPALLNLVSQSGDWLGIVSIPLGTSNNGQCQKLVSGIEKIMELISARTLFPFLWLFNLRWSDSVLSSYEAWGSCLPLKHNSLRGVKLLTARKDKFWTTNWIVLLKINDRVNSNSMGKNDCMLLVRKNKLKPPFVTRHV